MIRGAISPGLATSTRWIGVAIGALARTHAATRRDVRGDPERAERLAQRGRGADGPRIQGERRVGPGIVRVEREAQRGEPEVARGHARALPRRARHPHQRTHLPRDPRARLARPLEAHAHAHWALLAKGAGPGITLGAATELQVAPQ